MLAFEVPLIILLTNEGRLAATLIFLSTIFQTIFIFLFVFQNFTNKYKYVFVIYVSRFSIYLLNWALYFSVLMTQGQYLRNEFTWFLVGLIIIIFAHLVSLGQLLIFDGPKLLKFKFAKLDSAKFKKHIDRNNKFYNKYFSN
ncbi:hypothetical protein [Mycoplasma testudineum]|uniref:hypothetical protein n=1 Tax=Mycoplasma testudineum TaxID=244584 RepID=UPI00105BC239|nr:hypothetical protein [Mycoplasma testudineum]